MRWPDVHDLMMILPSGQGGTRARAKIALFNNKCIRTV